MYSSRFMYRNRGRRKSGKHARAVTSLRLGAFVGFTVLMSVVVLLMPAQAWFQREPIKILEKFRQVENNRLATDDDRQAASNELPVSFPTSRQMMQDWNSALALLETDKTDEALGLLQEILDSDEDSYLLDARNRPLSGSASLKGAAREVLEQLPAEMHEQYELQWGANADRLWEQYQKTRLKSTIEELVRRYPVSRSGLLARERLAAWNFDRQQPLASARIYESLWRSSLWPSGRRADVAIRAAAAWHRAGFTDRARELLVEAKLVGGTIDITLAGKVVEPIADEELVVTWLEKHFGRHKSAAPTRVSGSEDSLYTEQDAGPRQWLTANGAPERNADGPTANPLWETSWDISAMLYEPSGASSKTAYLQSVWKQLQRKNRREGGLPIPTTQPLIVGDNVVYRTLNHVGAVRLSSGELAWETIVVDPSADVLIEKSMQRRVAPTNGQTPVEKLLMNRAWQNLTSATLSSDGEFVYVLDDMGYLRTSSDDRRLLVDPLVPRGYNRLLAFDIRSGKLRWEAGDGRSEVELPLAGLAFLGPPLAVDGDLYCLVLDGSEQLLIVLDAETGELKWELSLVASFQIPAGSVMTPLDGLSPSLSQGVLVCPTGLGTVAAVDVARRELLWAFTDETAMNLDRLAATDPRFIRAFPPQAIQLSWKSASNWLDGLPIIEGSRVLLTIPGSRRVNCLSLADGKLLWSLPREDGLFVAGVAEGRVLIVDREKLRCHWLDDGSPAWESPLPLTSEPCGRGVRSGTLYQLPLDNNEIVHVDIIEGQLLTRTKLPDEVALGNLIGASGVIVSQTPARLTAFRSLRQLHERVEAALADDPNDAEALSLRGEIRLSQGAEQAGLDDLRASLKHSPHPRTQERFVTALTEGLRSDFENYRKFRDEVEPYLDTAKLRWNYLKLYADGLRRTGETTAAFSEYLALTDLAGDPTLDAGRDETLDTPPRSWIRKRLSDVYRSATPDERSQFDREIQQRWEFISRKSDASSYQQFARTFHYHPLAKLAAMRAVELGKSAMAPIERELSLAALTAADDLAIAGYAYAEWTRLLLDQRRYEETGHLFEILEHHFSEVECYPNKTGSDLAIAWKLEVSKAGASPQFHVNWPTDDIKAAESPRPQERPRTRYATMPFDGDPGPFLRGWTFEIDHERTEIRAKDPLGRVVWSLPLEEVQFLISQYVNGMTVTAHNHLLVVNLIHGFLVIDTLESRDRPRVLWQQALLDPSQDGAGNAGVQTQIRIRAGGLRRAQFFDVGRTPLGQIGPVTDRYIGYQVGRELFAADVLTGEILWKRDDVPAGSQLIGNDEIIAAIPPQSDRALVLDSQSGMNVNETPIPPEYEQLFASGQTMLCWKKINDRHTLYLLDLVSAETVWEQQFDSHRLIWIVEDDEIALMNAKGELTVYRIADGTKRFSHSIDLANTSLLDFVLLRSSEGYLLLTNTAPPENSMQRTFVGLESRTVNGPVSLLDRETGEQKWQTNLEYQAYDLSQPGNLPVAIFSCRRYDPESLKQNNPRGQFAVHVLDLRSGKTVYEEQWSELRGNVVITPEYDRKRIVLDANVATIVLEFKD